MVTVAVFKPLDDGVKVIRWFIGVSLPLRLPRLELIGVKSNEPVIETEILFNLLFGLPPPAVLSSTKALLLFEPTSTLPKSVKFVVLVVLDPLEIIFPFPDTSSVPCAYPSKFNETIKIRIIKLGNSLTGSFEIISKEFKIICFGQNNN
jgi:hypothetical protein